MQVRKVIYYKEGPQKNCADGYMGRDKLSVTAETNGYAIWVNFAGEYMVKPSLIAFIYAKLVDKEEARNEALEMAIAMKIPTKEED